jgi:membrane protease YdiL (CAAX protease family)
MNSIKYLSKNGPITGGLLVVLVALIFRINDIFILKIDELWGEIIISKSIGFLLVIMYILYTGKRLKDIGLHSKNILLNLIIGTLTTLLIYTASYLVEYLVARAVSQDVEIIIGAIDSKQGVTGGAIFGLWLFLGNIVNSFMEEGLFRGLLVPKLLTRYTAFKSIIIQGVLFGLWHLVWPLKEILLEGVDIGAGFMTSVSLLLLGTTLTGIVWGYMYYRTNSLWTSWIAHVLTNTILNMVHIRSDFGLDATIVYRNVVSVNLLLLSILVIRYLAKRYNLDTVKPWKA